MYQEDHTPTSGLRPHYLHVVSSHSLVGPHTIEEVDMEELHAPPSNYHEEMPSSESESSAEYEYDN